MLLCSQHYSTRAKRVSNVDRAMFMQNLLNGLHLFGSKGATSLSSLPIEISGSIGGGGDEGLAGEIGC